MEEEEFPTKLDSAPEKGPTPMQAWEKKTRGYNQTLAVWLIIGALSFPTFVGMFIVHMHLPDTTGLELWRAVMIQLPLTLPAAVLAVSVASVAYNKRQFQLHLLERPTEPKEK